MGGRAQRQNRFIFFLKSKIFFKKFSGLFPSNFVEETSTPQTNGAVAETKAVDDSKVIVKVDAQLLDSTLLAVESADPAEDADPADMVKNEEICKQMGNFQSFRLPYLISRDFIQ